MECQQLLTSVSRESSSQLNSPTDSNNDRRSSLENDRPGFHAPRRVSVSTSAVTRPKQDIGEEESLSDWKVFAHLFKATLGAGVLSMPSAVKDAGLLVGTLGLFLVALVLIHAMHLLVKTAQFLRCRLSCDNCSIVLDYGETVRQTIHFGFGSNSRWTHLVKYLKFCLIVLQIGFISIYNLFVAENTKIMVDYYDFAFKPSLLVYQAAFYVLFLPLVFIKTLTKMAFLSSLANFLGMLSLAIIITYCMLDLKPLDVFPLAKDFNTIPLFLGVIFTAFESINVVLPIENKMANKGAMLGFGGLLNLTMVVVLALFTAVAFYGYLCFGESVRGSIIYSMPMSPWYVMIAKPMYTLSIFISYSLQFYVLFMILWECVEQRLRTPLRRLLVDALLRFGLVTLSFILAISIPHIKLLISLLGSFTGSSLTLLFPAFLHSVIIWKERRRDFWFLLVISKNMAIFLFGFFGAVVGTYTSIVAIANAA